MKHPLHIIITQYVEKHISDLLDSKVKLVKDQACGGNQQIPLFLSQEKSRKTELCKVDLAIIQENELKTIIEIDTKIIPTQICGKFLTSALASYYIHRKENKPIPISDNAVFIQILDSEFGNIMEKEKTAKIEQGENIEANIQDLVGKMDLKIKKYKLFWANEKNLETLSGLIEFMRSNIS